MEGTILGIFGAGGSVGNSISKSKVSFGRSGSCGGLGNSGISGMLIFNHNSKSRASGKSGILSVGIFLGTKANFGNVISNHSCILDRSIYISGNLKGGIGKIGRSTQSKLNLHE
jgi:hypothetical protein